MHVAYTCTSQGVPLMTLREHYFGVGKASRDKSLKTATDPTRGACSLYSDIIYKLRTLPFPRQLAPMPTCSQKACHRPEHADDDNRPHLCQRARSARPTCGFCMASSSTLLQASALDCNCCSRLQTERRSVCQSARLRCGLKTHTTCVT